MQHDRPALRLRQLPQRPVQGDAVGRQLRLVRRQTVAAQQPEPDAGPAQAQASCTQSCASAKSPVMACS
jgi:hypothetical protein